LTGQNMYIGSEENATSQTKTIKMKT